MPQHRMIQVTVQGCFAKVITERAYNINWNRPPKTKTIFAFMLSKNGECVAIMDYNGKVIPHKKLWTWDTAPEYGCFSTMVGSNNEVE